MFENLPFEDEFRFGNSSICCCSFKDAQNIFKEAERVLRPGGELIITNINQKEAPEVKTKSGLIKIKSYYHIPEQITRLIEESGLFLLEEKTIKEKELWINQIVKAKSKNFNKKAPIYKRCF